MRHLLILGFTAACIPNNVEYQGVRYGHRGSGSDVSFVATLPPGHELMGTLSSVCERVPETERAFKGLVSSDFAATAASVGGTTLIGFECETFASRGRCCTAQVSRPRDRSSY
jgi:hypothetical protein